MTAKTIQNHIALAQWYVQRVINELVVLEHETLTTPSGNQVGVEPTMAGLEGALTFLENVRKSLN